MGQHISFLNHNDNEDNVRKENKFISNGFIDDRKKLEEPKKKFLKNELACSTIRPTARPALKRTHSKLIDATHPVHVTDILHNKQQKVDHKLCEYPFLEDITTIRFFEQSKIMIILRGLPGCGKSTLAKTIQKQYPDASICSADDFFMVDGKYNFNGSLIKEAHEKCQRQALLLTQLQEKLIVIDNTNIKKWEMEFYIKLSNQYSYIPLIIEPNTPWKRDLASLVVRNTHGMGVNQILQKIDIFQDIVPLYYGWFLNEMDSHMIQSIAFSCVEALFNSPKGSFLMLKSFGISSFQDFERYFKKNSNLHCTAKYICNTVSKEHAKYMARDSVNSSIGKVESLVIVGFVLTPRTFGVRIKLSDSQLDLWCGNKNKNIPKQFWITSDIINGTETAPNNFDSFKIEDETVHEKTNKDSCKSVGDISCIICNKVFHEPDEPEFSDESDEPQFSDESDEPQFSGESDVPKAQYKSCGNDFCTEAICSQINYSLSCRNEHGDSLTNGSSLCDIETTVDEWRLPKVEEESNKYYAKKRKVQVEIPANSMGIVDTVVRSTFFVDDNYRTDDECKQDSMATAHMTLACANDVSPVTTGLDANFALWNESNGTINVEELQIEDMLIKYYGHDLFVFYMRNIIKVNGIFNAFY